MRSAITLDPLPSLIGQYTIWIGWDAEISTYYASVLGPDSDNGPLGLVWEGSTDRRYLDPEPLIALLRPYAIIPDDLAEQLLGEDQTLRFEEEDEQASIRLPADLLGAMAEGLGKKSGSC